QQAKLTRRNQTTSTGVGSFLILGGFAVPHCSDDHPDYGRSKCDDAKTEQDEEKDIQVRMLAAAINAEGIEESEAAAGREQYRGEERDERGDKASAPTSSFHSTFSRELRRRLHVF